MKKEKIEKWWNTNTYISGEIVECIDKMLERPTGYPSTLTPKKWKIILTKIRDGFEAYKDCGGDFWVWKNGKRPPHQDLFKNKDGHWEFPPTPKGYEFVIDKKKKHQFAEAMKLFAQYFDSLWD